MNEVKGKNAGNKWSELYKMAERKKERQNRDKDEIEYLKNPEEFTFQPNSHKAKGARRNMSPKVQRRERLQDNNNVTLKTAGKAALPKRDKSVPTTLRGGAQQQIEELIAQPLT